MWACAPNINPEARKEFNLNIQLSKSLLQKVVTDAVSSALRLANGSSSGRCATMGDRGSNIRAAIKSGRSKSAVRRQFRLTDYEYRGHKATVTRQSNGY